MRGSGNIAFFKHADKLYKAVQQLVERQGHEPQTREAVEQTFEWQRQSHKELALQV